MEQSTESSASNAPEITTRSQAIVAGALRYFTGKPCKRGHVSERRTASGYCLACHRIKMASLYVPGTTREAQLRWRKNNPQRVRQVVKSSKEKNGWKYVEGKRRWAAENSARRRVQNKAWKAANPVAYRVYAENRRLRKLASGAVITIEDVNEIMLNQRGLCRYCSVDLAGGFNIDHRMPLRRKGAHHPSNIQLLCEPCNLRKGSRNPDEYEAAIGFVSDVPVGATGRWRRQQGLFEYAEGGLAPQMPLDGEFRS